MKFNRAILLFFLVGTALLLAAGNGYKLFQQGLAKERADADPRGAIQIYEQVVQESTADRKLAAQALYRIGECQRALGDAAARKAYERVVSDYADQKEVFTEAQARLAAMRPAADSLAASKGDRVVWTGKEMYSDGRVSPDGRFISYTDYYDTGNLAIYDLKTGTHRHLTGNKDWTTNSGVAGNSTFSRDGKQLAYGWRGSKPELRIISVDETSVPRPRTVFKNNEDRAWIDPTDWSPDGRWLAVHMARRDGSAQIGVVSVQDGSYRGLRTVDWRGAGKMFFSPDGKHLAYDLLAGDDAVQRDVFIIAVDGSQETRAVENPAHDSVIGWSPDGNDLLFASDRTGPMGLWSLRIADGKPISPPVLLKPDIGAVSSLGLTASGTLHILKNASTTRLQLMPIDLAKGRMTGPPVVENYGPPTRADWSADGKFLAYNSTGSNGIKTIAIRSVESGSLRELQPALQYFPFPRWMADGRSLIAGGKDLKGRKGIYQIDARTGEVASVTEGGGGPAVSPDGKKIYYGVDLSPRTPGSPGFVFVERDLASGATRDVYRVPDDSLSGFAEVSPDGRYLAAIVSDKAGTTGALVRIPVSGGEVRELLRVKWPEWFHRYGYLSWTPDNNALVVVKFNGNEKKELWLVPVSGGQARKLEIDVDAIVSRGITLSRDGRQIAFVVGDDAREIWALENFLPVQPASK